MSTLPLCQAIAALFDVRIEVLNELPSAEAEGWSRVFSDVKYKNHTIFVETIDMSGEVNEVNEVSLWHEIGHLAVADEACVAGEDWEHPFPQWVTQSMTPDSIASSRDAYHSQLNENAATAAKTYLLKLFNVDRDLRVAAYKYDTYRHLGHLPVHLYQKLRKIYESLPQFHELRLSTQS